MDTPHQMEDCWCLKGHAQGKEAPVPSVKRRRDWNIRMLIDKPPITANESRKWHWGRLHSEQASLRVITLHSLKKSGMPTSLKLDKITVELVYYPGNNRRMDSDNIAPTLKPIIDVLVEYRVVVDDNSRHILWTGQRIVSRHADPDYSKKPRLYVVITDESEQS